MTRDLPQDICYFVTYQKTQFKQTDFLKTLGNKGMGKDIQNGKSMLTSDEIEFRVKVIKG